MSEHMTPLCITVTESKIRPSTFMGRPLDIVCDSSIFGCILPPKKRTEAHKTSTKNASSSFPPDGDNASELPLANQELSD